MRDGVKAVLIVVAVLVVIGMLVGDRDDDPPSSSSPAAAGGGGSAGSSSYASNPVYRRIYGMTDCVALQAEFDIADENASRLQDAGRYEDARLPIKYMDWADDRMQDVGCYG